jgi:PAS domain S-box-containing protein
MPSLGKIKFFRFVERFFILLFVGWTFSAGAMWFLEMIKLNELVAGVGVSFVIFIVFIYVQKTVDSWLMMYLSRSSYIEEDIFDSLYERSPVAFFTIGTRGKIVSANPAAIRLLHGELRTITQVNFTNLIEGSENADVNILKSKIESAATISDQELLMSTLDGQEIWVRLSTHAYRNAGEKLVSLTDVTEQKKVDTAKSEFVALATHQLRTPIAAIRWNVELLGNSVKQTETEAQTRYLDKINRNVLRMIDLINDFLSVSKLEMGTYASEIVDTNLTDFLSAIVDEFSEKITQKGIVLNRQDNPPQAVIQADSRLLHIVVSNLVSNALKYIQDNGELTLVYEVSENNLAITVEDNGIGIPKDELSSLFTKFYRASNAQSHQTEGTGLGLYIVKQSVEQMGGTISVESDTNEGAKFTVILPI